MQKLKSAVSVFSYVLGYFTLPFLLVIAAFRSGKNKNSHGHSCGLRIVGLVITIVFSVIFSIILALLSAILWFFFGGLFKFLFFLFIFYLFFHIIAYLIYCAYCRPKAPRPSYIRDRY